MPGKQKRKNNKLSVQEPKELYILINDQDEKYEGIFKDLPAVKDHFEAESMSEGTVLVVTSAFDISYPEEPEPELTSKRLSNVDGVSK